MAYKMGFGTGVDFSEGFIQHARKKNPQPVFDFQVGSAHEAYSYTVFNRYLNLAAFPVRGERSAQSPLWNLNIYSVGESNDLRAIMPYLAAAGGPFLGKNSGQQQSVSIGEDNPLLLELRQQVLK